MSALRPIKLSELKLSDIGAQELNKAQLKILEERSGGIVLTDDYAPVENLLASMTAHRAKWRDRRRLGRKLLGEGVALVKQNQFDEAITRYRKVLGLDPFHAEAAHYNIATLLARQGKLDEAIAEYRGSLHRSSHSTEAHRFHIGLAKALFQQKKLEEAARHYTQALQTAPNSVKARAGLGDTLLRQGNFSEAEAQYREALRTDPEHVKVRNNLGSALFQQDKFKEAVEQFRKALDIDPDFTPAQRNIELTLKLQRTTNREGGEDGEASSTRGQRERS